MNSPQTFIPISKAKAKLLDIVRELQSSDHTVAITRNGIPEAVLISADRFQGFLETIEILADETVIGALKKSIRQAENDEWIDAGEVLSL